VLEDRYVLVQLTIKDGGWFAPQHTGQSKNETYSSWIILLEMLV